MRLRLREKHNSSRLILAATVASLGALLLPGYSASALALTAIGAGVVIVMGIALVRFRAPPPFWMIAASPLLFTLGDTTWDIHIRYSDTLTSALDYLPDMLWISAYFFLAFGLVLIVRPRSAAAQRAAILDSAIIALAGMIPVWEFLITPALADATGTTFVTATTMAYPLLDLMILGALLHLALIAEERSRFMGYLLAGVSLSLVADSYYLVASTTGRQYLQWLDAVWVVSYALIAAAIIHPSARRALLNPARQRAPFDRMRVGIVTSTLLVAPVTFVIASQLVPQRQPAFVFGVISAAVVSLTLWRVMMLVGEIGQSQNSIAANERRFRSLVQHAADIIMVVGPDARVQYASPAIESLLGKNADAYIGRQLATLVHPIDLPQASEVLVDALSNIGVEHDFEARFMADDGSWRHLEARVTSHLDDPAVAGLVANLRDVTERKAVEQLRAAENKVLDLIARGASLEAILTEVTELIESGISGAEAYIATAPAGGSGTVVTVSPSLSEERIDLTNKLNDSFSYTNISGVPITTEPVRVININDTDLDPATREEMTEAGVHSVWSFSITSAENDYELGILNCLFDVHTLVGGSDLEIIQRAVQSAAIAIERNSTHDRLTHLALHDVLTGLPNRSLLLDRLGEALRRSAQPESTVCLLFLDIDRFKVVNDSLGHDTGDEVIVALSERIAGAIRPGDTVARFGGDEFVVLCEGIGSTPEVEAIAVRISDALRPPFQLGRGETYITASIGIALARDECTSAIEMLRDADAAMYRAKHLGRARYEIFDTEMHANAMSRMRLENSMHTALANDQFRVEYQPLFDVATRSVAAVEALTRWDHPTQGTICPGEFIPLAEETGLIVPIGSWILNRSCEIAAARDLTVSVNISGRQIAEARFVDSVRHALDRNGLHPENLCLEVTESVLLDDEKSTLRVLTELKDLGIGLSIDDFGTGYSALSYLRRFLFSELKIDQSFVAGLGQRDGSDPIVQAMVEMAHSTGMIVVAEGVETDEQLEAITNMGCDRAQGFLLAPPMSVDALDARLVSERVSSS